MTKEYSLLTDFYNFKGLIKTDLLGFNWNGAWFGVLLKLCITEIHEHNIHNIFFRKDLCDWHKWYFNSKEKKEEERNHGNLGVYIQDMPHQRKILEDEQTLTKNVAVKEVFNVFPFILFFSFFFHHSWRISSGIYIGQRV